MNRKEVEWCEFNRKDATDAIKQEKGRQEEGKDIESEMYFGILVSLIPQSNACVLHEYHLVPFSFVPYFLFLKPNLLVALSRVCRGLSCTHNVAQVSRPVHTILSELRSGDLCYVILQN